MDLSTGIRKRCVHCKNEIRRTYDLPVVEREVSCRLVHQSGAVFKFVETLPKVNEAAITFIPCCICDEEGKRETENEKKLLSRPKQNKKMSKAETQAKINKTSIRTKDGDQKAKYLLNNLKNAIRDDIVSEDHIRTEAIMHALRPYPLLTHAVMKFNLRHCDFNVTKFLLGLLTLESGSKAIDKRDEYSYNQQLYMSAICFLEMPYLLQHIDDTVPDTTVTSEGHELKHDFNDFEYASEAISKCLSGSLSLASATFPDIEKHPSLINYLQNWQQSDLSRKKMLLAKNISIMVRQQKDIYNSYLPTAPKEKRDKAVSWTKIERLRSKSVKKQKKFLDRIWNARYRTSQKFCSLLHPEIFDDSELFQLFVSYAPLGPSVLAVSLSC